MNVHISYRLHKTPAIEKDILHQIENELALTTPAQSRYMDHLYAKARTDGITVPIFHNDQGRNGYWVPRGSGVEKTAEGPADTNPAAILLNLAVGGPWAGANGVDLSRFPMTYDIDHVRVYQR